RRRTPCGDRLLHRSERIAVVGWHKLVAELIARGVEAHSQTDLRMSVREPADPRRDPDGRHCEMTRAHPEAIALGQLRERSEDVTLVREGFSHAHEDNVAEALR